MYHGIIQGYTCITTFYNKMSQKKKWLLHCEVWTREGYGYRESDDAKNDEKWNHGLSWMDLALFKLYNAAE